MLLKVLGAPVGLPVAGFRYILETIRDMVERELYDEDRIREELLLLQLRLDEGELDEAAYDEQETLLLAQLRAAREYHGRGLPVSTVISRADSLEIVDESEPGYGRS
jgi:hypothetical protein